MEQQEKQQPMNELRAWLLTVPVGDADKVKRIIIEKCKSKDYIFRNWKLGVTKVPLLERSIINDIAKEYNGTNVFKIDEP